MLLSNCLIQRAFDFQAGTYCEEEKNLSNFISIHLEGVQLIYGKLIAFLDNSFDFIERELIRSREKILSCV